MWGRRALENNPNYTPSYRVLAVALSHLGKSDEARAVGKRLLQLIPDFTTANEKRLFRLSGKLPLILSGLRHPRGGRSLAAAGSSRQAPLHVCGTSSGRDCR